MAPKGPKKRKRRRKPPAKFRGLTRKLRESGLVDGQEIVIQPSGKEKMSEVIERFVDPYIESAHTPQEYRNLIALGIVAALPLFVPAIIIVRASFSWLLNL